MTDSGTNESVLRERVERIHITRKWLKTLHQMPQSCLTQRGITSHLLIIQSLRWASDSSFLTGSGHSDEHALTSRSAELKQQTERSCVTWQPVFYWVFDEYVCSHKALSVQQTKHYCHTWWWAHSMPQFCLNRNIGTTCPLHEHMSWCHALILTMSWKTQTKWNALTQYEHFYITWNGRNSSHALLDKENDTGGNNVINNATTIRTTTSTEQ